MSDWDRRRVPFKFQLSDLTLFSLEITLQMRAESLVDNIEAVASPGVPGDALLEGSEGFVVRGMPVCGPLEVLTRVGGYLRYVPQQYQHCHIDLRQTFEEYQKKFSSKTRSTVNRKVKKFADHCGGALNWRLYKEPEQMREYFQLARQVSKLTYQERLLDAGLPDSEEFLREAERWAAAGRVRAYILFDGARPVSYLYCPVTDGVLSYSYVGYDPEYMDKSVGLVLQWMAVQQLFEEGKFLYFDFTEGSSDHKRLFSTHQRHCANVYFVRRGLRNAAILYAHAAMDRFSAWSGAVLTRYGLKSRLKRVLRFSQ
ncbi:GNAT family N-acetyltransferase [Massilia cavernae]|uniref:GNAT family N-acetyltransferase n=1 Tax=Massilia cavernae TaxID=2320864 RepID=A0A418XUG0_9BURK|nr:GNAT family N-acetyltransferase [Massilia cavernae]RJG16283.1 GNAT family N-acetyltransferase [Massilia cavernae]